MKPSAIPNHSLLPDARSDTGSGRAYIAALIEAMVGAGLKVGVPRDVAFRLATKTLTGTAGLLSLTRMHPAELRDSVPPPAATAIAGVYELDKGSLRTSIMTPSKPRLRPQRKVAKRFERA